MTLLQYGITKSVIAAPIEYMCVLAGYQPYRKAHLSMHQMGSCRQGSSPMNSVTDGEGQCWDVANLYVADASTFPTATGA